MPDACMYFARMLKNVGRHKNQVPVNLKSGPEQVQEVPDQVLATGWQKKCANIAGIKKAGIELLARPRICFHTMWIS